MPLDAYSPCPCGSGKKFKWCCHDVHVPITKAYQQDEDGQHEVALKLMDDLAAAHPNNPEVWGRKADLLWRNQKPEEAEAALQKAFDLNPNYAFGLFLQGLFRHAEGELRGALLLFHKAADLIDPEAKDLLGSVWTLIADSEMKMNRPVASRAAMKLAVRCNPADEGLRNALDGYDDERSPLPKSARRDYAFEKPAASLPAERKAAWDQALARGASGKMSDAAKAFWELTESDPNHAPAWYNLALLRAWLGDNRGALDALDRYIHLESDAGKAAAAWALGEALRFGQGMEEQADVLEYSYLYQIADPQRAAQAVQYWQEQRKLIVFPGRENEPVLNALVLERPTALTAEQAASRPPHLGAYLLIIMDRLRIWHTDPEALERVRTELLEKSAGGLAHETKEVNTPGFRDALSASMIFPVDVADPAQRKQLVQQENERYFEEKWLHQPRKSLNGTPPIDAAGHPVLRNKLAGIVQFMEECAVPSGTPYDFDRLRRKLGLLAGGPVAAATPTASEPDIAGMGVPELVQLPTATLSDDQLEKAYQSALKLDARDLAGRFALELVGRPPRAERPDRYPWYAHLVQLALAEGKPDAALDFLNEGEKADCEQNEGRRRNDYELRRGQLHAKRGEFDQAQDVFDRLIERVPAELRYRGTATEAMLTARQGGKALRFAEPGLALAREKQDRDSEQYFLELIDAAKRQG
ncbi:MAG: tetratricopeptide repeat protein [Planctomycetia bacterium]|nr:tetratricopeptide repeat protein [Planctomycetia bacterium]